MHKEFNPPITQTELPKKIPLSFFQLNRTLSIDTSPTLSIDFVLREAASLLSLTY